MIKSTNLLVTALYMHIALAYISPRQTRSFFPNGNKTSPSSPNITPGSYPSSGAITAGKYFLHSSETDAHSLNDIISPINASTNASLCRFAVQDTININYWASYYMRSFWVPFNVTSIVTAVTQYIDTTVTRHLTNVTTTETETATPQAYEGLYPIGPHNNARGPLRAVTELKDKADLTSWGSTFSSPGTFYIYPTVKIITVPAITQKNGRLACTTAITSQLFYNPMDREAGRNPCGIRVFTGMNSNAQRYFDSSRFYPGGDSNRPAIALPTHGLNERSTLDVTTTITSTPIIEKLVFATPFVYKSDWGDTNRDDYGGYNLSTKQEPCPGIFDYGMADYGYVPQALIDQITTLVESLLPGGPSIVDAITQSAVAPLFQIPAEDLTVSTAFTVTIKGCFNPEGCLVNDALDTATKTVPTPQSQVQRPISKGGIIPQASKTDFAVKPDNTHRVTAALKPSAVESKVSAVSSGKMAHPPGESPITTKVAALLSQSSSTILEFQFDSQTRAPGGVPIVFSSKTYSLTPSVTAIFINRVASTLVSMISQGSKPITSGSPDSLFNDGSIFQVVDKPSPYIVGGHKVMPGSASVVVSGTTYSLDSSAATIVVNDVVSPLPKFEEQYPQVAPILSIGSQRFTANAASEYIVGGRTVSLTGKAIVVSGSTYSLAVQAPELVLSGATSILPGFQRVSTTSRPVLSIGSPRLTADAASGNIVDGQTLSSGGTPLVVSGTTYSLSPQVSAIVVNGITSKIPEKNEVNPTSGLLIEIGSQYLTADSALKYIMGGETSGEMLVAGSTPIIVSGTTYSLVAQASALVVNGVTSLLPTNSESSPLPKIRIGSQYLTLGPTLGYNFGGKTLIPGATPIVFSSTTYSLAPEASALVINGITSKLPEKNEVKPTSGLLIEIGSQYLTADSALKYIMGGETLVAGSTPIIVSGTTYSLAAQASALVVNGVTSLLPTNSESSPLPEIRIGSQYLTLGPTLGYNFGGKTLIPGATPIVFSGTTYSLAPQATALVVNGRTSSLQRNLHQSTPASSRPQYILGGQTLSPGVPAITILGVAVSLAASGNTIVINGTSYPFQPGTAPSLTIGSQPFIATQASLPVLSDQTSKIEAAAGTTSDWNTPITPSATNVVTGSTNGSLSTTLNVNGDKSPGSGFTAEASRGGIGWTQILMVLLFVLGLAVL